MFPNRLSVLTTLIAGAVIGWTARASEPSRPPGTHSHRALGTSLDRIIADSTLSPEQIRLKKRFFAPVASRQAGVASFRSDKKRYLLIQLEPGKADKALKDLKTRGVSVLEYVPVAGISAMVPAGVDPLSVEGVRWAGRMQADDKLSPAIEAQPGTKRLVVDLHPGASATEAAAAIAQLGPPTRVLEKIPLNSLLVETDDAGAERVANLEVVSYLFPAAKNLAAEAQRCPGPLTPAGPLAFYSLRGEGWDGQGANSFEALLSGPDGSGDASVAAAAGMTFAARGLWGRAAAPLEVAARAPHLPGDVRRRAWRLLAQAAQGLGDDVRAAACEREASRVDAAG